PYPYPYPGPAVGASGRQGVRASDLARSGPGRPVGPRREEHLAADRETAGGAEDQLGLAADVGQADLHAEAHGEGGGAELVSPHVDVDAPAEGDLRVGDHRERGVLVRVDVLDEGVPLGRVAGRHRAALRVLRPGGGDGAGDRLLPALTLLDDVEAAA